MLDMALSLYYFIKLDTSYNISFETIAIRTKDRKQFVYNDEKEFFLIFECIV